MKKELFTTPVYSGKINVTDRTIDDFKIWLKFEKELNPVGSKESTTQNGWQHVFTSDEPEPNWLTSLNLEISKIREEIGCARTKTVWVVDYNVGGFQDPHFHTVGVVKVSTILINLIGEGEVILQDPRPLAMGQGYGFAVTYNLSPGDWLAMPAYVIHNSRPCTMPRSILVMDVYIKDGM